MNELSMTYIKLILKDTHLLISHMLFYCSFECAVIIY